MPARTHGRSYTVEYRIWTGMLQRCYNPKVREYRYYGAQGITVCPAWRTSFAAFLADMGLRPSPKHSVERLDNGKGYEPENCIWADRDTQANHRRNNRQLTYQGLTMTLTQWAVEKGLHYATISSRLALGWSVEDALTLRPKQSRSISKIPSSTAQQVFALLAENLTLREVAQRTGTSYGYVQKCAVSTGRARKIGRQEGSV